jgi:hypothetical protein
MAESKTMRRSTERRLRVAIDALPRPTRLAMREGVVNDTILAGAFVDPRRAGVCPMMAAHRRGAPAEANRFARAWDSFCEVGPGECRPVTTRELSVLSRMLEDSLDSDDHVDLSAVVREHRALRRARHRAEAVSFAETVSEHQAMARGRKGREAVRVGTAWLRRQSGDWGVSDADEEARTEPAMAAH